MTKGAKQIVKENLESLTFYRNLALGANIVSLIVLIFYHSTLSIVSLNKVNEQCNKI